MKTEIESLEQIKLSPENSEYVKEMYSKMYTALMAYAYNAFNNHSQAEEAVQETFKIACTRVAVMRESPNPKGWLMNVLKNVMRNMNRTMARLSNLILFAGSYEEYEDENKTNNIDVDVLYSDLTSDEDYILLKLIVFKKYTLSEAAEKYGISVEACKKRVQRAKKRLREKLERDNKKY